jgi:hypothetical protein
MGSDILIRNGIDSDIEWIVEQLEKFAEFFQSKFNLFPGKEYTREFIKLMFDHHLFLVAQRGQDLLGFVAGYKTLHPFNPKIRCLTEIFWWLDPKHRGSRASLMLLDAFTDYGKEHCDWIVFTREKHSPFAAKHLEKRGYGSQEVNYYMEVVR